MKRLFILFIGFCFLSCDDSQPSGQKISGEALGTSYQVSFFSEEKLDVKPGLDSIFSVINQSMSTYQEDSDISRLNRGDMEVRVDEMFQEVFRLSKRVNKQSNGYFDPTVGDLVNLYGFGPEKGLIRPDSSSVDSLMRFVGMDKIRISPQGVVQKTHPQVYLDFNSIAKGYAVDVIGRYLDSKNVDHYLVELGGELLAKGENIGKPGYWTVGIDDPLQENEGSRPLKAVIELRDRAMATSGNYRKFRIDPETGEKFVHTINPLTGYPERSNLLSATVLAENCALADAYATSFMALGLNKSQELLEMLDGVDVFFIYTNDEGEPTEYMTKAFKEVVVE